MGLQGPPYAVLSPLVTDPPDPPGDPESSLFLTCHFGRNPDGHKIAEMAFPTELMGQEPVFRRLRNIVYGPVELPYEKYDMILM